MRLAPSPPTPPRPTPREDDLVGDLPALDGDDGDQEDEAPGLDDDALPRDDGHDPFDDAAGGDETSPADLDVDVREGGESMLDATEADALDVGEHDTLGEEGDRWSSDKDDDAPHDDYGLGAEPPPSKLDAGEEGPEDDDESLTDDGLPALAGGDDGAEEDAAAFFEGELGGPRESRVEAWSSLWERFGTPLSLPPVRALALAKSGVIAAGRELSLVGLEGGVERRGARGLRGGEVTGVVLGDGETWVTTDTGGLFVSRDGGGTFAELAGWRSLVRPDEAAAGLDVAASADGVLWARTAQGALLTKEAHVDRWSKADIDGFVQALGVDADGRVLAVVRSLSLTEVLRQSGTAWVRSAVPSELLSAGMQGPAKVVGRGASLAFAAPGDGVLRCVDGGVWSKVPQTEAVTALAMLDEVGTLAVALATDDEAARATLVRVGADGEPEVVAVWEERSDAEGEGPSVTAIAVDDAHEVVWVGGGFGVAAFQPRMRAARGA